MRTLHTFFWLSFFMSFSAWGQGAYTLADTAVANRLLIESDTLFGQKKYDDALAKADSALMIFEQVFGAETEKTAAILSKKASISSNNRAYKKAIELYERALKLYSKLLGENHPKVGNTYENLGATAFFLNDYGKSLEYYRKALDVYFKLDPNHEKIPLICTNIGGKLIELEQFKEAFVYLQRAETLFLKRANLDESVLSGLYYNYMKYYNALDDYEKSIEYNQKTLAIIVDKQGYNSLAAAACLISLGNSYSSKGDFSQSFEYQKKALKIQQELLPPNHYNLSIPLMNIANFYNRIEEYDKAHEYYLKTLNIRLAAIGYNHEKTAMVFHNIGVNYLSMGDHDKALEYYQKGLGIQLKTLGETGSTARSYEHVGSVYDKKGIYDTAMIYYQKSLDIVLKTLGPKSFAVATLFDRMAGVYNAKHEYAKAIEYEEKVLSIFQKRTDKALVFQQLANIKVDLKHYEQADSLFNESLKILNYTQQDNSNNNLYSLKTLVTVLTSKAAFERQWYTETQDIKHLYQAIETYKKASDAITYHNKNLNTEGSKLTLKKKRLEVYEGSIFTHLMLAHLKAQDSFKLQAFEYNEQSKAGLLQAQIKEAEALKYAGIPDNLLQKEAKLRVDITWQEKQRQEKLNSGKSETDSTLLTISAILFDLRQQYETLKQLFEKNYPDYYRLKYDLKTVNIADIQQKMLSPQQSLLSYFVGDSTVFAFVVRLDTFAVFEIKKDFPLEAWIKQLRDGLYGYHTADKRTDKLYDMKADSFAQAAFQLHTKLLTPLSNLLTKEVIIVPDGVLGYVPFDVLLAEMPTEPTEFKKHNYFGKEHIISYNYSATLWQEMRHKKHKTEPKKPFIGFAPYFNGDSKLLDSLFSYDIAMRKGLDSLKNSGEEVYRATKLMGGEAILNKDATKQKFEQIVGNYRIVHLATHGKANDKIGDYCFLAFTEQKDSLDNELLYVRDIYNLSLNADLVVLSACETGIGELKRGEGIVSLSRAFAYAGAKSMVTTLWSVNDKSTMQIMEGFYRQLKKGKTKDYALWKAKQEYLEKVKDKDMAHPFFWSAFIPIGDMSTVKK